MSRDKIKFKTSQNFSFTVDVPINDNKILKSLLGDGYKVDYKDKIPHLAVTIDQCGHCPYIRRFYFDNGLYEYQCIRTKRYLITEKEIDPLCPFMIEENKQERKGDPYYD